MPKESTSLHLRLVALIPAYDIPKDGAFIITKKLKALLYTPVKSFTEDGERFNQITSSTKSGRGTAVAQWLRCCATNRKVAGSIPAGVSGLFIDIKSFRSHYSPGVDSATNRNENQEYFLGVKAAGA